MIKQLAGCIREYRRDTIWTPILVCGEVIMEVLIPLIMADLIDYGITDGNMNAILKYGIALVICAVISLLFGVGAARTCSCASTGFAKNLRHDIYYRIQDFSFANIDRFTTGSLITRLTTDVTNVQMAFMVIIRIAVRSVTMLIFSLIVSFRINVQISMVFVIALPILALGLFLIIRYVHPLMVLIFRTYDKLNSVVQENLHGIRVVKSYVREEHEINKFADISETIFEKFSKAEKILAFNAPLMMFCMYICMIGASWVGAHLVTSEVMSTGELISIMTYAIQMLMSLMMMSMIFVMVTISRASAVRIREVLQEKSTIADIAAPVRQVKEGSVTFEDVSFSYAGDSEKLCLYDVNVEIKAGETVGILGGTGSAKSTLVQLIPRLYDVTEGRLLVGGVDVRKYDLKTLRDAVAVVLQKNELFGGTIRENMRWGDAEATDEEIEEACKLAQADGFIRQFPNGYDTMIEQGGTNVSGGQKQRLCIARALLKKPKILILDDSTSAVDTKTDALIRKAFREKLPETTKFIIAQRIASVQDADKILIMEEGRILEAGSHEELMRSSSLYREVYESQQKGGGEDA